MSVPRTLSDKEAEANRVRARKWARANAERNRARARAWHAANRERANLGRRLRALADPEGERRRNRDSSARRRARELGAPMGDVLLFREYALIVIGDPCSYCGDESTAGDHIVSLLRGGAHDWSNITGACKSCNSAKSSKSLLEFLLA